MNNIDISLTMEEATVLKDVLRGHNEYVSSVSYEALFARKAFCNDLAEKIDRRVHDTLTNAAQVATQRNSFTEGEQELLDFVKVGSFLCLRDPNLSADLSKKTKDTAQGLVDKGYFKFTKTCRISYDSGCQKCIMSGAIRIK